MRPQLGITDVIQPSIEPFGAYHHPVGAELGQLTHSRGEAAGTQRSGGAIAPPVVFPLSLWRALKHGSR